MATTRNETITAVFKQPLELLTTITIVERPLSLIPTPTPTPTPVAERRVEVGVAQPERGRKGYCGGLRRSQVGWAAEGIRIHRPRRCAHEESANIPG